VVKGNIFSLSNEKTQTEGENQKDRRGDLPMDKLLKLKGRFIEK